MNNHNDTPVPQAIMPQASSSGTPVFGQYQEQRNHMLPHPSGGAAGFGQQFSHHFIGYGQYYHWLNVNYQHMYHPYNMPAAFYHNNYYANQQQQYGTHPTDTKEATFDRFFLLEFFTINDLYWFIFLPT